MLQEEMACPITKGEKILVAVDGSRYSDNIVDQAISMGRICNSVIIAISVVELFASGTIFTAMCFYQAQYRERQCISAFGSLFVFECFAANFHGSFPFAGTK